MNNLSKSSRYLKLVQKGFCHGLSAICETPKIVLVVLALSTFGMSWANIVFAADKGSFLADKHKIAGISCTDCHGNAPKQDIEWDKCLGCHETYAAVAKRTAGLKPNPHDNHLVDLDCLKCHQGHKPQENYCNTCHKDLKFEKRTESNSKKTKH